MVTCLTQSDYIKDTSLDFCKKQKLKGALIKSVELIKSSSFDEVSKVIDERPQARIRQHDWGMIILQILRQGLLKKSRDPVTTGWHRH